MTRGVPNEALSDVAEAVRDALGYSTTWDGDPLPGMPTLASGMVCELLRIVDEFDNVPHEGDYRATVGRSVADPERRAAYCRFIARELERRMVAFHREGGTWAGG